MAQAYPDLPRLSICSVQASRRLFWKKPLVQEGSPPAGNALVLEKAAGPGGVSTSWKRKGYTFEGGIHWLIGAKKEIPLHQIWLETGALQENNPVFFKDPIYTLVDEKGTMPLFRDLHGLEVTGFRDKLALWRLRFHLACFKNFHQPISDLRGLKVRNPKPFSVWEYVKMLMRYRSSIPLAPFMWATAAIPRVVHCAWHRIWPTRSKVVVE